MSAASMQPVPVVRVERPRLPNADKMILLPLRIRLKSFERYLTADAQDDLEAEFTDYLDEPQYPVLVGNRLVDRMCSVCLPKETPEKGRELLGRAYIECYAGSLLGRLLPATKEKADSFDWLMRGLPRNYSAVTNFGTYWVAQIAPRTWRFDFEDDPGYPEWVLGTLLGGNEILQIPGYKVTYQMVAPEHFSFEMSWEQ